MRIPFEGMLAAATPDSIPLVVSIWGNDLTLHANGSVWMKRITRRVLKRSDGLLADAQRDIRLGLEWGFRNANLALVVPGNGGVRTDIFFPPPARNEKQIVLNPRGIRDYVRNDTFFQAIPLVLEKQPAVVFQCAAMAGSPEALTWVKRLKIAGSVELLEPCPQAQMAELFRGASIVVSPSSHDGTPNTLLEAMACGCFPVAGDLESLREWITPGENGLLIDPSNPRALADAILSVLEKPLLRDAAKIKNSQIIAARAEYGACMAMVDTFYQNVAGRSGKVDANPV
jgi:glycosyltransferase involved in cell wall biosynthesis